MKKLKIRKKSWKLNHLPKFGSNHSYPSPLTVTPIITVYPNLSCLKKKKEPPRARSRRRTGPGGASSFPTPP